VSVFLKVDAWVVDIFITPDKTSFSRSPLGLEHPRGSECGFVGIRMSMAAFEWNAWEWNA
jgi:hypothetical protein